MSSLGARRKARVIQTLDDDEPTGASDKNQDSECLLLPHAMLPFTDPNKGS